jgi:hypothetical protein
MSLFVYRSLFVEMGKGEKPDTVDSCCPIKMKTGTKNAQLGTTIGCPRPLMGAKFNSKTHL